MKVLGEGRLAGDGARAVGYVGGLSCVDAVVIGMTGREEIDLNCRQAG